MSRRWIHLRPQRASCRTATRPSAAGCHAVATFCDLPSPSIFIPLRSSTLSAAPSARKLLPRAFQAPPRGTPPAGRRLIVLSRPARSRGLLLSGRPPGARPKHLRLLPPVHPPSWLPSRHSRSTEDPLRKSIVPLFEARPVRLASRSAQEIWHLKSRSNGKAAIRVWSGLDRTGRCRLQSQLHAHAGCSPVTSDLHTRFLRLDFRWPKVAQGQHKSPKFPTDQSQAPVQDRHMSSQVTCTKLQTGHAPAS